MNPTDTKPRPCPPLDQPAAWTPAAAERCYHVHAWGDEYFSVNAAGHVAVRPFRDRDLTIDVYDVVCHLRRQGIGSPVLLRFQDLLRTRVAHLHEAFHDAIAATGYRGRYQGVYPIKTNQLREVVEEILEAGRPYGFGLECGSKAELVAALPYVDTDDMLLLCNGVKDATMMRLILAGQRLGQRVLPVLERMAEFELLRRLAPSGPAPNGSAPNGTPHVEAPARFGVRVRLSTAGSGLWSESGGEHSKFGLSLTELLALVDQLERAEHPPSFELLHFHLGSQIASLETVRDAVREAARIYARLRRRGLPLAYFDIGGGLGVPYEAGHPGRLGSINYTLEAYARAVVETLCAVCDAEGVPHPVLVSESGRALTAHHSLLVVDVVEARQHAAGGAPTAPPEDAPPVLHELHGALRRLATSAAPEAGPGLHRTYEATFEGLRRRVVDRFRAGALSLEQKAWAERTLEAARLGLQARPPHPENRTAGATTGAAPASPADQYLCNFSVFRSMLDHWAIGQRFPILPIHRLGEAPTRRGILVDLTCDSDGRVADFVTPTGEQHHLELHPLRPGEPYFLGFFLMGAYQDILGDMHNLFGNTTEAHVYADAGEPGHFYVETILQGTTVAEQLALVQYYPNDLERRMNALIQASVRAGTVRPRQGVELLDLYRQAFSDLTYLRL